MTRTQHGRHIGPVKPSLPRDITSQLCELCLGFEEEFLRPADLVWRKHGSRGVPRRISYSHHKSWLALKDSAKAGCQLCELLRAGYLAELHFRRHSKDNDITIGEADLNFSEIMNEEDPGYFSLHAYRKKIGFFHHVGQHVLRFVYQGMNAPIWDDVYFVLGVEPDSPAMTEGKFQGRICSKNPDLKLAKRWLTECQHAHSACQTKGASKNPARLIWLSEDGTHAKLIQTNDSQSYKYVTLSHRWGIRKPISTMRENLQDRHAGIVIASLPELFKDAVLATHTLGFRYLWIDSLCIVQDDLVEWALECATMAHIYQGSQLTIAAADSMDSWSGFLGSREFLEGKEFLPCSLQYRNSDGNPQGEVVLWYPGHPRTDQGRTEHGQSTHVLEQQPDSVLEGRGWVFQERILSHRILYFGRHQMYFDCMENQQYEMFHYGEPHSGQPVSALTKQIPKFSSSIAHHSWWRQIVEAYSRCKLTVPTDKLPAIAGIANAFRPPELNEYPEKDVYLAGLWRNSMPRALLWHRADCREAIRRQSEDRCSQLDRAPSWSWASQDFPITYLRDPGHEDSNDTWNMQVQIATVEFSGRDPFGHVARGSLHVRAKLRRVTVARYDENGGHFSVYSTLLDKGETAAFYPDELSPYQDVPRAEQSRSTLGYRPTNEELDRASYPEILAILVGDFRKTPRVEAAAIAILPVPGTDVVYQRVGLLHFKYGRPAETVKEWFDDIEEQDLEII